MVFFLTAVSLQISVIPTCKLDITFLLWSVGWQSSQMHWDPPTTYLVFPTVSAHCYRRSCACGCSRLCSLCFSDLVLAAWALIHSLRSLSLSSSLSLGLSVTYLLPVYILITPQNLCFCLTLFSSPQVIYKKFNVPCPFREFSFNTTTTTSGMNATDPGGEVDPACIPKMANLNSQVGSRMSLTLQIYLHCHGLWQPPTCFTVIFSMLPVPLHRLSMGILVWSTRFHWRTAGHFF